jgi:hypothetical protein
MNLLGKVRRLYYREGLTLSEIERRTALKLFGQLQAQGFDGDYSRVTEFIRHWKAEGGATVTKAFVPLQFGPGEAHQFDWSEEHLVIGDPRHAVRLVWSRHRRKAARSGASPHACAARKALQLCASGAAARFQLAGYSRAANALSLGESVVPPGRATPSVK